jgi:hypothetical protein
MSGPRGHRVGGRWWCVGTEGRRWERPARQADDWAVPCSRALRSVDVG